MKLLIPRPKLIRPIMGRDEADRLIFHKGSKFSRLPDVYKKHWVEMNSEWKNGDWCHERRAPKYSIDHEYGIVHKRSSIPIPIMYPIEADKGLWGGEGVVAGYYLTKNPEFPPHSMVWNPTLMKLIMKSRLLNKRYAIMMTRRTVAQIEKCEGFDEYILSTHPFNLYSKFGIELKKEMLTYLNQMADDEERLDDNELLIFNKYKQYREPNKEVIEWMGLSLDEAMKKLQRMEARQIEENIVPLKYKYEQELKEGIEQATASGVDLDSIQLAIKSLQK